MLFLCTLYPYHNPTYRKAIMSFTLSFFLSVWKPHKQVPLPSTSLFVFWLPKFSTCYHGFVVIHWTIMRLSVGTQKLTISGPPTESISSARRTCSIEQHGSCPIYDWLLSRPSLYPPTLGSTGFFDIMNYWLSCPHCSISKLLSVFFRSYILPALSTVLFTEL